MVNKLKNTYLIDIIIIINSKSNRQPLRGNPRESILVSFCLCPYQRLIPNIFPRFVFDAVEVEYAVRDNKYDNTVGVGGRPSIYLIWYKCDVVIQKERLPLIRRRISNHGNVWWLTILLGSLSSPSFPLVLLVYLFCLLRAWEKLWNFYNFSGAK